MNSGPSESSRGIEVLAWLEVNKWRLVYAAAALVVAGFVVFVYRLNSEHKELAANLALFQTRRSALANEDNVAVPAASLLKIAEAYRGTGAGRHAELLAAAALFQEGKYAEARQQFDQFLQRHTGGPLAAAAAFGRAACLDALNQTNEAIAAYQRLLSQFPNDPVAAQAKLALADLHLAGGQAEAALKLLDELAQPTASTVWRSEAAARREYLLLKHPELARTNAPPAAPQAGSPAPTEPAAPANAAPEAPAPSDTAKPSS